MESSEKKYRNPTPCVDGVLIKDENVLLIKRGHSPYEGKWALPGGFVEYGETTENAVTREFQEETGLSVTIDRLVGVYSDPKRDPRGHNISITYLLSNPKGEPKGGDDAKEAKWWPIDNLPELAFDHEKILRDCIRIHRSRKD